MKVGDLVKYAQLLHPMSYSSGVVLSIGKQKATIFWPDGNVTFPSINSLEVISEMNEKR